MKVICTQENLKTGLVSVGRIISSSVSLPILSNVLLKTENGLLKISSTNLEIAVTTYVRCKVEEEGVVTVACKTLSDLVGSLPNKNITLETKETELSVETENYHTTIKTLPAEEFPLIPEVENVKNFSLSSQELKQALTQVVFAVSTNQTQPEISGVLFKTEGGVLKIAATDRYRLAEKKLNLSENPNLPHSLILPQKTIIELSRNIGTQEGQVQIAVNETQISFTLNNTQIVSRLIDGEYPPYEQIIPSEFTTTITTNRQALVNGLRAGGVFSQNNASVKVEYDSSAQALVLHTESGELGKSVVELPSRVEGQNGGLMVNFHYLLECLANLTAENVVIKVTNDSSPSLLTPENNDSYLYLVMPIKN